MTPRRRLYWTYSAPEDPICLSESYHKYYQKNIRCHGTMWNGERDSYCTNRRPSFTKRKQPLDVEVIDRPQTPTINIGTTEALGMREDLWKLLQPDFPDVITGNVQVLPPAKPPKIRYVTMWVPQERRIDINRGEDSWHNICPICQNIDPLNFNDKECVLTRSLDARRVYFSTRNELLLDGDLVDELSLRTKFRELRFRRIRVIDEPLDGDVLPGDPEWTGTFVPQDLAAKVAAIGRKHKAARRKLDLEMKERMQGET